MNTPQKQKREILDLHSHVLPGVDHGSLNIQDTKKLLSQASKAGITHILATSHFYPSKHSVGTFCKKRDAVFEEAQSMAKEEGITLFKGAEIQLNPGLSTRRNLKALTLNNTNFLLIEMPFFTWNNLLFNEINLLLSKGYKLIIAHIERYPKKQIDQLMKFDVYGQINAYSLFTPIFSARAKYSIKKGYVNFIGSDAHIYNYKIAYSGFEKARKKLKRIYPQLMDNAFSLISNSEE